MSGLTELLASRSTLYDRRAALRAECGLDAFAQPAEVWLEMAVAAATRGEGQYARDCERAMDLSNERWGARTPATGGKP